MNLKLDRERVTMLVIEMVAIVFSVLLALAVNEWRQSLNNQAVAKSATDVIRHEVATNTGELTRSLAYHDSLLSDIRGFRHTQKILTENRPAELDDLANPTKVAMAIRARFRALGLSENTSFGVDVKSESRVDVYFSSGLRGYATFDDADWTLYGPKSIHLKSGFLRNDAWEVALATQAPPHMNFAIVTALSEIHRTQEQHNDTVRLILRSLYEGAFLLAAFEDLVDVERRLLKRYSAVQGILPP